MGNTNPALKKFLLNEKPFEIENNWFQRVFRGVGIFLTPDSCSSWFFTPRKVVFSKICDTLKKSAKKFRRDRDSNLWPLEPRWEKLPLGHGVNFCPLQISIFRFIRYQNSNGFGIFAKFYPRKKFAITFSDFSSAVRTDTQRKSCSSSHELQLFFDHFFSSQWKTW